MWQIRALCKETARKHLGRTLCSNGCRVADVSACQWLLQRFTRLHVSNLMAAMHAAVPTLHGKQSNHMHAITLRPPNPVLLSVLHLLQTRHSHAACLPCKITSRNHMCRGLEAQTLCIPCICCRLATLMQHAVLAARTIVTAQSPADERAALLGYIGASYGLGFALGPAAGGLLSSISLQATAWAAAAGSVLALAIVALLLPAGGTAPLFSMKHAMKPETCVLYIECDGLLVCMAVCCRRWCWVGQQSGLKLLVLLLQHFVMSPGTELV